jgi:hypothetical protein
MSFPPISLQDYIVLHIKGRKLKILWLNGLYWEAGSVVGMESKLRAGHSRNCDLISCRGKRF